MEENNRDINKIAHQYNLMLANIQLPDMKVDDLLDLVEYYSRTGMDFEAELYKRIAMMKYPDHPDVILMCAHWEADEGNWNSVRSITGAINTTKYDDALFDMEKMLRMMVPNDAYALLRKTLNPLMETDDYDFLFDAAELFRDFGYMDFALICLHEIPTTYVDYRQVLELSAECAFYLTDYNGAIKLLDRAIDLNPFDDYLWAQTALLHYKNGDHDKAVDACEYSLAILKDNPRAEHLKNLLRWQEDGHYDMTAATYLRQDYTAMQEIADIHYVKGDYANAEAEYMAAGFFCPRGNHDRVQIVFKTACARVMSGRCGSGVKTLLSALNSGFDLWPYAFELLQLLLKQGEMHHISTLFLPIMKLDKTPVPRIEQLMTELCAAHCFGEAKDVWLMIFTHEKEVGTVYAPILQEAKKKIEEE